VLSEHPHMQALHRACVRHLGNAELYAEIKEELRDMSQYLDSDAQRRQSTTVTRLTVVTTFSLIGTVATGFLGMNIIDEASAPLGMRLLYLAATVVATTVLTLFLVRKSRRLSDLMDRLSDEKLPTSRRLPMSSIGRRGDE
jgi:Mg2+ and Co2+ transporter CorA